jgi:CubicO group peptidase (beta-lactamase class C family)
MDAITKINGDWDPKFSRVKNVFEEHFAAGKELGAAVAVTIDGHSVIDLWGGYADPERIRTWERDTLVNVFSTTKGITATCVHRLVDQGLLDLEQKVSNYWPEFGQRGDYRTTSPEPSSGASCNQQAVASRGSVQLGHNDACPC